MNNRDIKFRLWHKGKNQWIHCPGQEVNLLGENVLCGGFCNVPLEELNDLEECQFIGKKDNQGREIYEGDIVKFDICGVTHGRYRENDCLGEVWYCEEKAYWAIGKFKNEDFEWHWSFSDDIDEKTLTIIGNVFENKELIK